MKQTATYKSFRCIVDAYEKGRPIEKDAGIKLLAEDTGVKLRTVRQWINRDSIPPGVWKRIVSGAAQRNLLGITLDLLADLSEKKYDIQQCPEQTADDHSGAARC